MMWNKLRRNSTEIEAAKWQDLLSQQQSQRTHRRAMVKEIGQIQLINAVGKAAVDGITASHAYNQYKISSTLVAVNQMVDQISGGRLSSNVRAALQQDEDEYVKRMLEVNRTTGLQIQREQKQAFEITGCESVISGLVSSLMDE